MNGKSAFIVLAMGIGICSAQSQPAKDKPGQGTEARFVMTDCVSFKEGKPASKLTVKFRLDDHFQSYVSARFTYPRQNVIKAAKVDQVYVFTFLEDEAAHNLKSAVLIDEKNPADKISDHSLIAKVVEVTDKSVVVEWKKDDSIKRFFSREHVFPIRNARVFEAGQTIKITFGPDNRHCKGYLVINEQKSKKDAEVPEGSNFEELAKTYLQSLAPPRPIVEEFLNGTGPVALLPVRPIQSP